jgi:hypothetical protein
MVNKRKCHNQTPCYVSVHLFPADTSPSLKKIGSPIDRSLFMETQLGAGETGLSVLILFKCLNPKQNSFHTLKICFTFVFPMIADLKE